MKSKKFHGGVMFEAFKRLQVKTLTPLATRILESLMRHAKGLRKGPEWDANLSYKTYTVLKSKGVPLN